MARLAQLYKEEVVPKLMREFGYTNTLAVPKVSKITLNMGVGESAADKKIVEQAATELALIAGQKPIITLARQSVASFKIRVGWPIGCKVTLRQERMYEFLDRLINIAIPRIRDFRGLPSNSFDGSGNYNMGIAEQIAFPEIEYDRVDQLRGLDVNIVTTAITDAEAKGLLKAFNFPFRN